MTLIGTLWANTDKRSSRIVRVTATTALGRYAVVKACDRRGLPLPGGKQSRIRIKPNGDLDRYRRHQPEEKP